MCIGRESCRRSGARSPPFLLGGAGKMTGTNGSEGTGSKPSAGEPPPGRGLPRSATRFAGVGVELAATVGGACLLGYWIDRHFETSPWGLLACAVVGVVGGPHTMIRPALREMARIAEQEQDRHPREPDDKANC